MLRAALAVWYPSARKRGSGSKREEFEQKGFVANLERLLLGSI